MYEGFFSLREAPFSITPDTDFFYPHEAAQAALNTLLVALRGGEGFLKIVGEVGCGKTLLCRQLLKTLQGECVTAYIPNPDMGANDLLMALAQELAVELPLPVTRHGVLNALQASLLAHNQAGRRVVVCIDEAQAIPLRTVESLRLLSNLETEKRKLLQLVLLGQPELDVKLAHPEIRQLLQRITFSEYLGPMLPMRVPLYLEHRLSRAALNGDTDIHVFEQWCHIATVTDPAELDELGKNSQPLAFDLDTYRLLQKRLGHGTLHDPAVFRLSAEGNEAA